MTHKWETSTSAWLEDDNGKFRLESTQGLGRVDWAALPTARVADVAQLLGASLPTHCQCSPIFPEGFAFCPDCGAALARAGQGASVPDWWGPCVDRALPRHVPHGVPVTSIALAASLEQRAPEPAVGRAERRLPRPPNAHVVFAAAHFGFASQRLLALAYTRNVLQYWDPNAQSWQVMTGDAQAANLSFTASAHAWLPAAGARRGEVGLLPSASGLVRLFINPLTETVRTETVLEATLASGPGQVHKHLACLVATGAGTRVWTAMADASEPAFVDCDAGDVPAGGWSHPVAYDAKLMWLHERGHLSWMPGAELARWIAWPAGWTPRLTLGGPTQSRDGRLWLLGHDGQGYSFLELGVGKGQTEAIDGARLGFASLLFRRGHAVRGEPWATESVENPNEGNAWVIPLLRDFNRNVSPPSGLVLRINSIDKAEAVLEAANVDATVEWIGQRDVILERIHRLSRPLDCVVFVYDGCLWLHNPGLDHILGWQL